jgi:YVTN family beta-propeller protein
MRSVQRAAVVAAAIALFAPAAATSAASATAAGNTPRAAAATPKVTATIPVGGAPVGVATNPRTNKIYVSNNADSTVSVISGRTNAVVATIPFGQLQVRVRGRD